MRLFHCQACDQVLYFENIRCERSGHALGFLAEPTQLSALEPEGDAWRPLAAPETPRFYCANTAYEACNWLADVVMFAVVIPRIWGMEGRRRCVHY